METKNSIEFDVDYDPMTRYPSYGDSNRRLDVENLIFSLTMRESMVVLLKSLSFKSREICEIIGWKNTGNVSQILTKLRKSRQMQEEF